MNVDGSKFSPSSPFSWDGFSISVPPDWNLAHYHFAASGSSARLEDDEAVRLQLQWIRTSRPVNLATVRARFDRQAQPLTRVALAHADVPDLPPAWTGIQYTLPDNRFLSIGYWLSPDARFFVFLQLMSDAESPLTSTLQLQQLAASFILHDTAVIPWAVYDVSFSLPRDWWLTRTAFDAGRKRFEFQHRLRRLWIWQFSVASLILRGRTPAQFAVDFLNDTREFHGRRLAPLDDTRIHAPPRRGLQIPLADDLARACLRYTGACVHLSHQDALFLSLLNYRSTADLATLHPHLAPSRFPWP